MIIPKLYGRLGNQCFQIAAAIAHAEKLETAYRVPKRTINPKIWQLYFPNLPTRQLISNVTTNYYREKRHCYDPIPEVDDLTIDGYFQTEKYWHGHHQEIADALGFKYHKPEKEFVAVHVRRGDFVSQFPDKHPPLPIDYYRTAMQLMGGDGFFRFKIYSDDIAWCKQNITTNILDYTHFDSFVEIEYSTSKDALTDMRDMYNASAFIIANSTFSLFPALLSRCQNVISTAEHRWYGPGNSHLETCDLLPERFIKLSTI